jgi:hypothetical protein
MTAPDPLELLYDRACVLADRVRGGELLLPDAVDMLWTAADFAGIVQRVGVDTVQQVLADAFIAVPRVAP